MQHVLLLSALLSSWSPNSAARGDTPSIPAQTQAGEQQRREHFDHELFFAPIRELVERAAGSRFAYRFRRVGYECTSGDPQPTMIWDGVTRIAFHRDGILLDEVHYEMAAEKTELPTVRRVVTYYSLSSGEYARATSLAGGGDEEVTLDLWSALPPLTYYALGLVGSDAYLDGCEAMALATNDDGVQTASCTNATGARLTLAYDMQAGGELHYVRADHPDGHEHDWIQFYDCVPRLAGGPLRPTLVTRARVNDDGCVREVFTWSSIGGAWADEDWDHVVAARASVMDFRCADSTINGVGTDRPVPLADLLSWPYPRVDDPDDVQVTYELTQAPQTASSSGLSWWLGCAVAVVLVAIGLRRNRS